MLIYKWNPHPHPQADEFLALAAHAREDIATRYPGASPPPPFFIGG